MNSDNTRRNSVGHINKHTDVVSHVYVAKNGTPEENIDRIVDMTCGHQGTEPPGFYNTHYIGDEGALNMYSERVGYYSQRLRIEFIGNIASSMRKSSYINFYYTGAA